MIQSYMHGISYINQWRSQTFPDGGAQSFYRILSMITHRHAGSYVHLLKVVVCMEKA